MGKERGGALIERQARGPPGRASALPTPDARGHRRPSLPGKAGLEQAPGQQEARARAGPALDPSEPPVSGKVGVASELSGSSARRPARLPIGRRECFSGRGLAQI